MNKLNIDNNKCTLENYVGEIKILNDLIINAKGNSKILIVDNEYNLDFSLENDTELIVNFFSKSKNNNSKININLKNNSSCKIVNSYINDSSIKDFYKISINGNNNNFNLMVNALAQSDLEINASIDVPAGTKNNDVIEGLRAYECGGKVNISPILYVNTNEVFANHKAVITNFENEDMFYLELKGLDKKSCIKLIKEGFTIKDFENEFKEKIRKEYYE